MTFRITINPNPQAFTRVFTLQLEILDIATKLIYVRLIRGTPHLSNFVVFQLALLTAIGVPGVLGHSVLKHVEYQEEPF